MDTGKEARQRAARYRKAIQYLDTCGELTLDKLLRAGELAGGEMQDDLRGMWGQSDLILPTGGQPGGKEYLPFELRRTLEEGARTFDDVADKLGAPKSGGCFLATAAYGSSSAHDVIVLQEFRDLVLLRTRTGRGLVRTYEAVSPRVARFAERSRPLRWLLRVVVVRPTGRLADRWLRRSPPRLSPSGSHASPLWAEEAHLQPM